MKNTMKKLLALLLALVLPWPWRPAARKRKTKLMTRPTTPRSPIRTTPLMKR